MAHLASVAGEIAVRHPLPTMLYVQVENQYLAREKVCGSNKQLNPSNIVRRCVFGLHVTFELDFIG